MKNTYRFKCVIWVEADSLTEARQHLHEEVEYHFGNDNNLIALQSDLGTREEVELFQEAQQ